MRGRIDASRRVTVNRSSRLLSLNEVRSNVDSMTQAAKFFQRRKENEANNKPVFDNKYHKQFQRRREQQQQVFDSGSDNSTEINSISNSHDLLSTENMNPLFRAQLENIEKKRNISESNKELNMLFDNLKSDTKIKKDMKDLSEVFTKINGSTLSSFELISTFKNTTNNILSYFSTISNQKDHIETVLLKIVEHLSHIIKIKGSNETNAKLLSIVTNAKKNYTNQLYNSDTNSDTHSETNSDTTNEKDKTHSTNTSDKNIQSSGEKIDLVVNENSSTEDDISIEIETQKTYKKTFIFGY